LVDLTSGFRLGVIGRALLEEPGSASFFQEIRDAFTHAGDEDSVFPIRHFYQRWGAAIAIERRPSVAARLHAAERALAVPDPAGRDQAVRKAAKIVQAAYRMFSEPYRRFRRTRFRTFVQVLLGGGAGLEPATGRL
jgi:hypothetical protein